MNSLLIVQCTTYSSDFFEEQSKSCRIRVGNIGKYFRRSLYINPTPRNYWFPYGYPINVAVSRTYAHATRIRDCIRIEIHPNAFVRAHIDLRAYCYTADVETKLALIRVWMAAVRWNIGLAKRENGESKGQMLEEKKKFCRICNVSRFMCALLPLWNQWWIY